MRVVDASLLRDAYVMALQTATASAVCALFQDDDEASEEHEAGRVLFAAVFGHQPLDFDATRVAIIADVPKEKTSVILARLRFNGILGDADENGNPRLWLQANWMAAESEHPALEFILDALCGAGHAFRKWDRGEDEPWYKATPFVDAEAAQEVPAPHPPAPAPGKRQGSYGRPAKLSAERLASLRRRYLEGVSIRPLCEEFGLAKQTVMSAVSGRGIYAHLPCDVSPVDPVLMAQRKTRRKMTDAQADEIRRRSAGEATSSLAREFEMDDKSIRQIIDGTTYRSAPQAAPPIEPQAGPAVSSTGVKHERPPLRDAGAVIRGGSERPFQTQGTDDWRQRCPP